MRKSDKKIENTLRVALTNVCEQALESIDGFNWITHEVDYQRFEESLTIICVFDEQSSIDLIRQKLLDQALTQWINEALSNAGIRSSKKPFVVQMKTENAMR